MTSLVRRLIVELPGPGDALEYKRAPAASLMRGVMGRIYEGAEGVEASEVAGDPLENRKVIVADADGNKISQTLAEVWTAIQQYFREDETAYDEQDGGITAGGRISVFRPAGSHSTGNRDKRSRTRTSSDVATKVHTFTGHMITDRML